MRSLEDETGAIALQRVAHGRRGRRSVYHRRGKKFRRARLAGGQKRHGPHKAGRGRETDGVDQRIGQYT
jgi:hypothetical protein